MRLYRIILTFILLSLVQSAAHSQTKSLPNLTPDPAIEKGQLPNGLTYYFASNKYSVNEASYALVQKKDAAIPEWQLRNTARQSFDDVRYGKVTLADFLGRHGILPSAKGYIRCAKGSIIYSFDKVSSARGEYVVDTVLLSIFSLAQTASIQGQPSSSQAIVIAGDFNKQEMLSRMKLLCLINPYVPGQVQYPEYESDDSEITSAIEARGGAVSRVSVQWKGSRVPEKFMETVFPVISDKLSGEFEMILHNRLDASFAGKDVWFDFRHYGSADGLCDETVSLTLHCPGSERENVKDILKTELDRLYTYGVVDEEYTSVRDAYGHIWKKRAVRLQPNELYLSRCISSFLYGSSLANDSERMARVYRNLPDSTQTRLFNRYLKGMLKQSSKVDATLSAASLIMPRSKVAEILASHEVPVVLKAPKNREEYITGGTMWTYSNGVNVIYKEMPTDGICYFAYAVKGGRQWAKSENFKSIKGIDESSFNNYLASAGLDLKTGITPTDVRFNGTVPSVSMEGIFPVFAAISDKAENEKVFGSNTYKLLVLVGDLPSEKVRKMLCRHIASLGASAKWRAAKPVVDDGAELMDFHHMSVSDKLFPFDVTTFNYAVSNVALYALQDELGSVFRDYAIYPLWRGKYPGLSLNRYRLTYGVRHLPLEYFPFSCRRLSEAETGESLEKVLGNLASKAVSQPRLKAYKAMAKNAFASRFGTAEFYIESALDRYLDNKDLASHFASQVDAVTAADIQKFFAAAWTDELQKWQ